MANYYTHGIGQPHTESTDDAPPSIYALDSSGNVTGLVGGRSVGTPHMSFRLLGATQVTQQEKLATSLL